MGFFFLGFDLNMFSTLCCNDFHYGYSVCISNDYNVYSFGFSECGSHGHEEKQIDLPTQINNLSNIVMISCGAYHTLCLNNDGNVFSFGYNNDGQLGTGKDYDELQQTFIPQKINLPACKQVSCGASFSICLTEDNRVYSFGSAFTGLGNNNKYLIPQLIPDFDNIDFIICGSNHCICKTYNNEFYSWGSNEYGQLGQGNNNSLYIPIQCFTWPDNIIDIKPSYQHTLLLTSKGQVYSFGNNNKGQLGLNDENIKTINIPTLIEDIPEIQRIECGNNHSMCIDINDNLWVFGDNFFGQLGLGDTKNRFKPILHPTLKGIIDISSNGNHTFFKIFGNKIYAFGKNNHSQLGITTQNEDQETPIQALQEKEEIWSSIIGKNKVKSAGK